MKMHELDQARQTFSAVLSACRARSWLAVAWPARARREIVCTAPATARARPSFTGCILPYSSRRGGRRGVVVDRPGTFSARVCEGGGRSTCSSRSADNSAVATILSSDAGASILPPGWNCVQTWFKALEPPVDPHPIRTYVYTWSYIIVGAAPRRTHPLRSVDRQSCADEYSRVLSCSRDSCVLERGARGRCAHIKYASV